VLGLVEQVTKVYSDNQKTLESNFLLIIVSLAWVSSFAYTLIFLSVNLLNLEFLNQAENTVNQHLKQIGHRLHDRTNRKYVPNNFVIYTLSIFYNFLFRNVKFVIFAIYKKILIT